MYHHICGELVSLSPTRAVVEAAGVGFEVSIPFSTFQTLKQNLDASGAGGRVRLLTHFTVREDSQRLFGFATEPERQLFRSVVAISGVGPAVALAILSSFRVGEFVSIIESGDSRALERIKGVGRKLAGRLMVELRDSLPRLAPADADVGATPAAIERRERGAASEALLALLELGFTRKDGERRVESALAALRESGNGGELTVEAILTRALQP